MIYGSLGCPKRQFPSLHSGKLKKFALKWTKTLANLIHFSCFSVQIPSQTVLACHRDYILFEIGITEINFEIGIMDLKSPGGDFPRKPTGGQWLKKIIAPKKIPEF